MYCHTILTDRLLNCTSMMILRCHNVCVLKMLPLKPTCYNIDTRNRFSNENTQNNSNLIFKLKVPLSIDIITLNNKIANWQMV